MRALLIVLDSVGVGAAPDAARYGDEGADTLGHILSAVPSLALPTLRSLGLSRILDPSSTDPARASYGRMRERSAGKDSTTGHWELAGVILDEPFATFDRFPDTLVAAIERDTGVRFLGNKPASGTAIIEDLGPEHLRTGRPILYTSADSVLQIAAHDSMVPVERLSDICRIARRHADSHRIGRVIARPFTGSPGAFTRTAARHDFSMPPPPTILTALTDSGVPVIGVGKTADLFAHRGITRSHPTASNAEGMAAIDAIWPDMRSGLLFANLVDFDTLYGHRRDAPGYARALAEFDTRLATLLPHLTPDDLLIITADHGNDPTHRGTDHTREEVPLLVHHASRADNLGTRDTFADVAATLSTYFNLTPHWPTGRPLLPAAPQPHQPTRPPTTSAPRAAQKQRSPA